MSHLPKTLTISIAAAENLLNRGWGKAPTVVEQTPHHVTPADVKPN